ncbi:MAG: serine/threonine protein kinase [Gammaproteobacteria bacterium]|nr:serine/threonine protein kinase [Gammaproteobacteria bacterium]MCP5415799.1 serine/threonine protein kinase [Chromatiaceae bacterium]
MPDASAPYSDLSPDTIIDALESVRCNPSGSMLALNSYENRVYQVGIEDAAPLVVKFYRPGRWSDASIQEEHDFSLSLAEEEIPVIAPLASSSGRTLHHFNDHRFSLFPRQGGRWPEFDDLKNLTWVGRFLGRIHLMGAARPFEHRPSMNLGTIGPDSSNYLLEHGFIPLEYESAYRQLCAGLQCLIEERLAEVPRCRWIRLHGDCHPGNILWNDQGPHFVDMDDCRMGPAIQDLWMLLSGNRGEMAEQLSWLREGYEVFRELDSREVVLIEPLRTLRMIHYAAWLARRWNDPAFPTAFPWFNTTQYWQEHLSLLVQQKAALQQSPLPVH